MDSGVCRWMGSHNCLRLGRVIYMSLAIQLCATKIRSLERGTNTPDLADRVSKLRAAERLSELGGHCATRLVQ
jgi:hypothetical protein